MSVMTGLYEALLAGRPPAAALAAAVAAEEWTGFVCFGAG